MATLFIIPARAGSKGLPGKNYKLLRGKPLIEYSVDFAVANMRSGDELCVSTNDAVVIELLKKRGIDLPFVRPGELATDAAGSYEVLVHAVRHYQSLGKNFETILLLQPTSPFRTKADLDEVFATYDAECDMVVTVKKSKENPYFNLFEENEKGFLRQSKTGKFENRQSAPEVYAYNGSMYLIRTASLLKNRLNEFEKIKKVVMPSERSIDIDTPADWVLAEYFGSTFAEDDLRSGKEVK